MGCDIRNIRLQEIKNFAISAVSLINARYYAYG